MDYDPAGGAEASEGSCSEGPKILAAQNILALHRKLLPSKK